MSKSLQAIRGMNDILPEQTPAWRYLESTLVSLLDGYGYKEIRLPIVEYTELFARGIGEGTDVVDKEMYTFLDRNEESLTLRPEGTAGCVRAVLEHGLSGGGQVQKLWYAGPMFRYEKPQKGRYRQFHQVGVEAFNLPGPDVDAELIVLTWRLWKKLGLADAVTLQLNSLGSSEARAAYRDALVAYLQERFDQLDEDSQRRLTTNPLRILDSKNEATQAVLVGAPTLGDYLDEESACTSRASRRAWTLPAFVTRSTTNWYAVWITTTAPCSSGSPTSSAPRARCAPVAVTMAWWRNWVARPRRVSASPWASSVWCCCWKPWICCRPSSIVPPMFTSAPLAKQRSWRRWHWSSVCATSCQVYVCCSTPVVAVSRASSRRPTRAVHAMR